MCGITKPLYHIGHPSSFPLSHVPDFVYVQLSLCHCGEWTIYYNSRNDTCSWAKCFRCKEPNGLIYHLIPLSSLCHENIPREAFNEGKQFPIQSVPSRNADSQPLMFTTRCLFPFHLLNGSKKSSYIQKWVVLGWITHNGIHLAKYFKSIGNRHD